MPGNPYGFSIFMTYEGIVMKIKPWLKSKPFLYSMILFLLNNIDYFNIRFRIFFPRYKLTKFWSERIEKVKSSPDNQHIKRVEGAGKIFKDYQLMHNGLKIGLGSYYDYGNTILIRENKGVHEPEEERIFDEVLSTLSPGSTIVELGSYWAFYSMWFASRVSEAKCFMVEPDPHKMNFGKQNFKMNGFSGKFILGYIGEKSNNKESIPTLTVDQIASKFQIDSIDILHSDIQGFELQMLKGSAGLLSSSRIKNLFISTHSNELHYQCIEYLEGHNYSIEHSIDLDQTYSWDGLIVAKNAKI